MLRVLEVAADEIADHMPDFPAEDALNICRILDLEGVLAEASRKPGAGR